MKLTIPKPCHENWENMTSCQKGRFCDACSKVVTDFTGLSDFEIIDELKSNPNACGNINASQLGRDLYSSFINSLFSKFAIGFVLTSVGIVSINAQSSNDKQTTASPLLIEEEKAQIKEPDKIMLRGAIRSDYSNNQPLYILDGKIVENNKIKDIDPNSIEEIEVMKSTTATAVFGVKGQYGIVVITTKRKAKIEKN